MPIYLTLRDAAARAIIEALELHDQQLKKDESKRDPYLLARAVDSIHIGVDKLLKHFVASVDPYLLLKNPKPELIRNLRGAILHGGASSIFSAGVWFETFDAVPVAEVVRGVVCPDVDQAQYTQFLDALRTIVELRNAVQHGELIGDSDKILAAVRRLLGELYPVIARLEPEFLAQLKELNGQAESRLKAYQAELDGAWQVLVDYLAEVKEIRFPFEFDVWLISPDQPIRVFVSQESPAGTSLSVRDEIPASDAAGLFRTPLSAGGELGRALQRALAANQNQTLAPLVSGQPAVPELGTGFLSSLLIQRRPKPSIPPLQDGSLHIRSAPGRLWVELQNVTKHKFVSADVILTDCDVSVAVNDTNGAFTATLVSGSGTAVAGDEITLRGVLHLDMELVLPEPNEKLGLPANTTWRSFHGTLCAALANQGSTHGEQTTEDTQGK